MEGEAPPNQKDEEYEPLLQSCGQINASTLAKLQSELGNGPMRFAPVKPERSIDDQIQALNASERACFYGIKAKWQEKHTNNTYFSDEMYLRFCRCSPGGKPFKEKSAWKTLKKFSKRYLQLTTDSLEQALRSKTVFPLPSLRTIEGLEVVYMRPSRHCVKTTDTRAVLDILGYTLSTMMEREEPCTKGIVLLANMEGFAMCNYATAYWHQLMSMLQGYKVPVHIAQLLIVNLPKWFKNIWNLTEPMLTADFVQRSEMIMNESDLSNYLAVGYEMYLPDEMETGYALTAKLVDDFVDYRKAVESVQGHQLAFQRRASMTSTTFQEQASSSHTSLETWSSEDFKSETSSKSDVVVVYQHHRRNKPRDALLSRHIDAKIDSRIAKSSSLEESQREKSGIWNTTFFARSSRQLVLSDDNKEEEEGEKGNTTSTNQQRPGGMRRQGMQRAASCRGFLITGKKVKSDDSALPRVSSRLGMMMQRQPSSDNLVLAAASPLCRPRAMRQQSHDGLFCEKPKSEEDQTKGKTSTSIPPRRFGGLLRQISQDRLPREESETLSRRPGGRRGDLVKQRLPSERLVAACPTTKTPVQQRSGGKRREMSKAKSFKGFLPSSLGKSTSSPTGRSNVPRQ